MNFENTHIGTWSEAVKLGKSYYFTGKPCKHGHISRHYTDDGWCYECSLPLLARGARRYYAKHGYQPRDEKANGVLKHTRRYMLLPSYLQRRSPVIGCTGAELRTHMEKLFLPDMGWHNYGVAPNHWQMDHIVPLDKFDLTDPVQLTCAAHYTNVRPLWRRDNLRKSYLD